MLSSSPSLTATNSLSILHQVPEGHVGVYWRGGALLKTITEPGFSLELSFWFYKLKCLAESFQAKLLICISFELLGFHLKLPLITQFEPIQVTLQTDQVKKFSTVLRLTFLLNKFLPRAALKNINFVFVVNVGEGYPLWYKRWRNDKFRENRGRALWPILSSKLVLYDCRYF